MVLDEIFTWRDERQVRWERYGSGPPVVLCHGTPWSSALWRPVADALSGDFTVHLWDMLGYGASSMVDGDVSLAVQGELLADLLDHWDLGEPHVVAHDYGGAVALRAHLLHGARYSSLALVDVVALAPWGSPSGSSPRTPASSPPCRPRCTRRWCAPTSPAPPTGR